MLIDLMLNSGNKLNLGKTVHKFQDDLACTPDLMAAR